jgi:hypothetical protein
MGKNKAAGENFDGSAPSCTNWRIPLSHFPRAIGLSIAQVPGQSVMSGANPVMASGAASVIVIRSRHIHARALNIAVSDGIALATSFSAWYTPTSRTCKALAEKYGRWALTQTQPPRGLLHL